MTKICTLSDIGHYKSPALSDNAREQILCLTDKAVASRRLAKVIPFPASDSRQDSPFVYKTSPLDIKRAGACIPRMHKPRRQIVSRFPVMEEVQPEYFLTYYLDTLSCGHQVTTHSYEAYKTIRGCQDCLALAEARKPVQSQMRIPFSPKKKRTA